MPNSLAKSPSTPKEDTPISEPMDPRDETYLRQLGDRLRLARTRRGMTQRALATRSGISLRFVAQTESGTGNLSVLRLRELADALGLPPSDLLADRADTTATTLLATLPPHQQDEAASLLTRAFPVPPGRATRIALIGLRGAGKSTLGRRLASARGVPFHELDREIERDAGAELPDIFELHGQSGFRRRERETLERLIAQPTGAVIATGGSIVATAATYDRLLATCRTIWLQAAPEDHMARVIAQGDLRPIRDNTRPMDDLRAILASREPLYARADLTLDTTGQTEDASLNALVSLLA
jgi:XRE family aerobic/anaerobic benzoate catabolism transcriptional regulator